MIHPGGWSQEPCFQSVSPRVGCCRGGASQLHRAHFLFLSYVCLCVVVLWTHRNLGAHDGSCSLLPALQERQEVTLTCISSTFPKKRLTGMGWLLSSSRKTLLSIWSTGARTSSVLGTGSACLAELPSGSWAAAALPGSGVGRPPSVFAEGSSLTGWQQPWGGSLLSGAETAVLALASANSLSQEASGATFGKEEMSLLGSAFCSSAFTR